jgi:outer membrane protein assembly factor BamD
MRLRLFGCLVMAALIVGLGACHSKKVQNPIATVDSKQPDKVLFDRAMEALSQKKYDTARITLQTLINTYPDSEYLARAKMALGDSWMAENSAASLTQAENEYKDFITFFPNLPEAAEAQMKIADIQYRQMEKPDRDFTHVKRAEQEYRQLLLQYPDSKLVPEAKMRLREVQEVLAEREFRIGRFYYLRESWAAAIARLKSLTDTYPLYSKADDALFMLGDCFEQQAQFAQKAKTNAQFSPEQKARLLKDEQDRAADAYSRLITRYPASDRARDAEHRLVALHRPVPKPTPEAIAQNKAEIASRGRIGRFAQFRNDFHRKPDLVETTRVGEPTLVDPRQTNATDVVRDSLRAMEGKPAQGSEKVSVETVGTGAAPENQATPRSSGAPASSPGNDNSNGIPELTPANSGASPSTSSSDGGPASAPPQVNQVSKAGDSVPSTAQSGDASASNFSEDQSSSSKAKKKKGFKKLVPF